MRRAPAIIFGLVFLVLFAAAVQAAARYGMSLFGDLKYGPDFRHFDYVNAGAPKGGTARETAPGTFHNFNGVVAGVKGQGARQHPAEC